MVAGEGRERVVGGTRATPPEPPPERPGGLRGSSQTPGEGARHFTVRGGGREAPATCGMDAAGPRASTRRSGEPVGRGGRPPARADRARGKAAAAEV